MKSHVLLLLFLLFFQAQADKTYYRPTPGPQIPNGHAGVARMAYEDCGRLYYSPRFSGNDLQFISLKNDHSSFAIRVSTLRDEVVFNGQRLPGNHVMDSLNKLFSIPNKPRSSGIDLAALERGVIVRAWFMGKAEELGVETLNRTDGSRAHFIRYFQKSGFILVDFVPTPSCK